MSTASALWNLWIDGCGGYTVVTGDRWSIGCGPASSNSRADVGLIADLPAIAGSFSRTGDEVRLVDTEGSILQRSESKVSDWQIRSVCISGVRPSPLDRTMLMTCRSPHRWSEHVDGILWVDQSATIGPGQQHPLRHLGLKRWMVLSPPKGSKGWTLRCPSEDWESELQMGKRETRNELSLTIEPRTYG